MYIQVVEVLHMPLFSVKLFNLTNVPLLFSTHRNCGDYVVCNNIARACVIDSVGLGIT